ncbi:MAG TPA: CPBP family intramembrane glutamic endopeptidase [Cyclobacteriaceae bacterium]|nr:CPBP family intramembrane glutamic endopeptidase [Cyclobacteriaceae bacterium]
MFEDEGSPVSFLHPIPAIILIMIGVTLGFVLVGPLIGILASLPFYNGGILELAKALETPLQSEGIKIPIYILQGFATLVGLIITPIILLRAFKKSAFAFFHDQKFYPITLLITPLIVVSFMGINSFFVQWNADVHFPEFLRAFENWAREKEDYAARLTEYMTDFASIPELITALFVIAVLPAIGEELVFRGLIQNELNRLTRNIHAAIWLSAVLFSAFHLQFFGFVPRMLLGALFGYLYYWSGNLSMSMLAHFTNNAVAVLSLYYYQGGDLEYNVEGTEAFPLSVVLTSGLITFLLLYYYWNFYQNRSSLP